MTTFREAIFHGKNAFVAGGTRGINLGIATRLAELGAKVTVIGRDKAQAQSAERAIREHGDSLSLSCDVRNHGAVRTALQEAVSQFGPLDFVISGAAGNFVSPALGMSANGFKVVVDIDLNGTFNVFHACYDLLRGPGSSLIAISAAQASKPFPLQSHACAAKAGINQLVRVLAMEWGPNGIRVNGISPGPVDGTEGLHRLTPTEQARRARTSRIPMRRFGKISEISDCAAFLCSGAASYITGTIIDCDGGASLGDASDRDVIHGLG